MGVGPSAGAGSSAKGHALKRTDPSSLGSPSPLSDGNLQLIVPETSATVSAQAQQPRHLQKVLRDLWFPQFLLCLLRCISAS